MLKRISNMMEDDGIRLQMEAELKREISDKEWMVLCQDLVQIKMRGSAS